jgi:Zn-dependent M28 family amino/carboxypeptidase
VAHGASAGNSPKDADTKAWWLLTGILSSDAMEGRDTGAPGYDRAADFVAAKFAQAKLQPMGDQGSFFQTIGLREARVESAGTRFSILRDGGAEFPLQFLHTISIRAHESLAPHIDAPLTFKGYCGPDDIGPDMKGRIVVCFGARRANMPSAAARIAAATKAGASGILVVDDPGFDLEPARWPDAYARTITFEADAKDTSLKDQPALPVMRLAASQFAALIEGTGQSAAAILRQGSASQKLSSFDIPARLKADLSISTRHLSSSNVLGLLPGTDPVLRDEIVVISAHLDGYGYGEPVAGDRLYNGAFDDAAYVATLMRLGENRAGQGFKRSVLFAAFTGEEKGLLGATWFTRHPTLPAKQLVAAINLDQLRPLFPLKILTMHGLTDSTLGETVRQVAKTRGITIRPDLEPERNLNQRADHYPFLKIGVPATGFVFGYDPGTEAEKRYREWYQTRYHRPQDDMSQPIDMIAARDFNQFFYALTGTIADADKRPQFLPGSPHLLR